MAGQITEADSQDQHAKAVWAAAQTDLVGKYNATQAREQQEMNRTQLQIIQAQHAGMTDTARLRAQAAAGSVGGTSIQEREQQPANAVSTYSAVARQNLAMTLEQNQLTAKSFLAQAQSTINETPAANPAAVATELGGDVISGADKAGFFMPPGQSAGSTSIGAGPQNLPDVESYVPQQFGGQSAS